MELMYFISGVLVTGTIYAVVLLRKNQSHYHDALARLQSYQNISSIRLSDIKEEINDIGMLIRDVESKMEKDQYASVSELNKKIDEIGELATKTNFKLGEANKVFNKNITDISSEMQQLKNNVKALGQDPNFLQRYS